MTRIISRSRTETPSPPPPPEVAVPRGARAIEMLPVSVLVPFARNARTHSALQVAQIAASMREFGFTNPILIDTNNEIIAGHGRLLAAQQVGLLEVPTIRLGYLTDVQKRALVIADNQLALNAGWDDVILAEQIKLLAVDEFDMGVLGFKEADLSRWLEDENLGETDADDAPAVQAQVVSQIGDVWIMGGHRLVCGDSTDRAVVARCLNGVVPALMVTDPPYGVNYDPAWRDAALGGAVGGRATGQVRNDDQADWTSVWQNFPGAVAYVWHGALHGSIVQSSLDRAGFVVRSQIVWNKSRFAISRGHYHWKHENAWYAVRRGAANAGWTGARDQCTVWDINHVASETGHGTQKPVECMKRPIINHTNVGQSVFEPFSGSGTTIIAGEETGRSVLAIEIAPQYVDVAVRRWQNFTGSEAILEGTSHTFAEVEAQRAAQE